jgi:Mg-chelatase subunit ChlI
MKMQEQTTYPFSAIVSLEDLKLALILNAVNPKIGGLLIRGPKGSGKTTAVRALIPVLPNVRVVEDCPFNCSPDDPSNMCEKCAALYAKNGSLKFE